MSISQCTWNTKAGFRFSSTIQFNTEIYSDSDIKLLNIFFCQAYWRDFFIVLNEWDHCILFAPISLLKMSKFKSWMPERSGSKNATLKQEVLQLLNILHFQGLKLLQSLFVLVSKRQNYTPGKWPTTKIPPQKKLPLRLDGLPCLMNVL